MSEAISGLIYGGNMSLQYLIKDKLKSVNIKDVADALGYSSTKKLSVRIDVVINSETLSLESSDYDFHYGTSQFIRKLCDALAIPLALCNKIIDEIETKINIKKYRFKSSLFIETNFKRKSEPIFVLACLEGRRYIPVDEIQDLGLNEQIEHVQRLIRAHYAEQTELQVWGKISQYVYYYDEKTNIIFSTSAEITNSVEQYSRSRATMSLR